VRRQRSRVSDSEPTVLARGAARTHRVRLEPGRYELTLARLVHLVKHRSVVVVQATYHEEKIGYSTSRNLNVQRDYARLRNVGIVDVAMALALLRAQRLVVKEPLTDHARAVQAAGLNGDRTYCQMDDAHLAVSRYWNLRPELYCGHQILVCNDVHEHSARHRVGRAEDEIRAGELPSNLARHDVAKDALVEARGVRAPSLASDDTHLRTGETGSDLSPSRPRGRCKPGQRI
jgi:hypothetical protein